MGMKQADFYSVGRDANARLVGSVVLDKSGKVVIPPSLEFFLSETKVHAPGGGIVTPDDGERYIDGLLASFAHGSRWFSSAPKISYQKVFGRKFNPNHDERGRFASGSANEGLVRQGLAGGFSLNAFSGHVPKTGYLVSTVGHEQTYKPTEFKADDIRQYVKNHEAELRQPGHFLGGWHDNDTNMMYLDVSDLTHSREEAVQRGVDRNQYSVYNVETKEYVWVPSARNLGTVKALKPTSGKGPEIVILDPNDPEGAYEKMMEQYHKNRKDRKNKDGSEEKS